MADIAVSTIMVLLALLHLVPALAAATPGRIAALYGVLPDDAVLATLLQHRAVLLGIVGALFAAAAIWPYLRWTALVLGTVSMAGFILIASQRKAMDGPLRKIVIADAVFLPLVVIAAALMVAGV